MRTYDTKKKSEMTNDLTAGKRRKLYSQRSFFYTLASHDESYLMSERFHFPAYAKINLGLRVLERRPDGYHNIATVLHRVAWHDDVAFLPSSDIRVVSSSSEIPSGETNICFRAAELLSRELQPGTGVLIELQKRIPVGAGLGGGSSDAATVLLELPRFWRCTVRPEVLRMLALELGSDVPYFLEKGSALATGRGERLSYFFLDIPYWILLCFPNVHVSTRWAYRNVKPGRIASVEVLKETLIEHIHDPRRLADALVNDFEPVVFQTNPSVREVKEMMQRAGTVFASMSGSGSSVFGFFDDEAKAREMEAVFAARGYRTNLTPPHWSGQQNREAHARD